MDGGGAEPYLLGLLVTLVGGVMGYLVKKLADAETKLEAERTENKRILEGKNQEQIETLRKAAEIGAKTPELMLEIQRLNQRIADMGERK
jgi:hypothetical protein